MPNMIFKMHECGLHYYDPADKAFVFTNTVKDNMSGFTKRQLKGARSARFLYKKLACPSVGDFRWVVQANQIEDCPVKVQDIDVAAQVWGKDLDALKGKTTRSRPIHVAADFIKVPKELLKLHKEVYITADIFFVNKIPFFLTLSRRIRFTAVNHLADRKIKSIFKAFEEIYKFHLNQGFRVTTVHSDGEFAPMQAMIQGIPGGPRVNLASASKHVPKIKN